MVSEHYVFSSTAVLPYTVVSTRDPLNNRYNGQIVLSPLLRGCPPLEAKMYCHSIGWCIRNRAYG